MLFSHPDAIFDTRVDTSKIYVPMKVAIKIRSYKNSEGRSALYLHATSGGQRVRINLHLHVHHDFWNKRTQRVLTQAQYANDYNLILDNVLAKVAGIKTYYRLAEQPLTLERFEQEFKNGLVRVDFLAFILSELELERKTKAPATYKKNKSFYNKLSQWKSQIYFHDLTPRTIIEYTGWCRNRGNNFVTINSDLAKWRKWLRRARMFGIKMNLQPEDFKVGPTTGNRQDLKADEVSQLLKYYNSEFIDERKKHALGIFLFICFTGLRIGDAKRIEKDWLKDNILILVNEKTKKPQRIPLTSKALLLFHSIKWDKVVSEQKMRIALKDAAKSAGVTSTISFHIGRHTFATNYLRAGGEVRKLQRLLNHKSIRETMIYVHVVEQELEMDIHRLDDLY